MKNKKYKAIVIGAGKIGVLLEKEKNRPKPATYAEAFYKNPRIELLAIVDINKNNLKLAETLFPEIQTYTNAEECINIKKPDIIAIASSTSSHLRILEIAKKSECKLVICEKPLSDTISSAKKMLGLIKSKKTIVVINHQRRFFSLFKKAKQKVKAGHIGDIQQVTAYYSNGLFNNGTHVIDTLRFLLDSEPVSVFGIQNKVNKKCPEGDMNVDGFIHFKNGTNVAIQSFLNEEYDIHEIKIFGTKGALFIKKYGYIFEWCKIRKSTIFDHINELDYDVVSREEKYESMIKGVVDHGLDCLVSKVNNQSSVDDAYKTLKVLAALSESAKEGGKPIKL